MSRAILSTIRYALFVNPFSTAFTRGLPHGILVAVHLPEPSDEIPESILHRLHADERTYVMELAGKRRNEWVGGRIAARVAARSIGVELPALLSDNFGAPRAPRSLTVSISHKDRLAVALVARRAHGTVGVDFEQIGRDRRDIAPKVLTAAEHDEIKLLRADRQWTAILLRFAIKEAIYKALAPRLRRFIGFNEAEISDLANGSATVRLNLEGGGNPDEIEVNYDWIADGVIATARVRWDPSSVPIKTPEVRPT
jgi:phosphopantetheine--protein transferase-like protein